MKKSALVIASVLVIGLVVSPKIVGYKINASVHDAVEAINAKPGYRAEIAAMDAGWLQTEATIRVTIDAAVLAKLIDVPQGAEPAVDIAISAVHGPILSGEASGLGWAAWTVNIDGDGLRPMIEWPQDTALYSMNGSAGILGSIDYQQAIPALSAKAAIDDTLVTFSGHQGAYSSRDKSYSSEAHSNINITVPQGSIVASIDARLVDMKPLPSSLDEVLAHGEMTGQLSGDKAATEYVLERIFEKEYAGFKFPTNMTEQDVKERAVYKMQFVLSVLDMQRLLDVTDTHYRAALNLQNNELTIHRKTISLPI